MSGGAWAGLYSGRARLPRIGAESWPPPAPLRRNRHWGGEAKKFFRHSKVLARTPRPPRGNPGHGKRIFAWHTFCCGPCDAIMKNMVKRRTYKNLLTEHRG